MKACHLILILSGCIAVQLSGCQTFNAVAHRPFSRIPTASSKEPVVEMICLWEPAEGVGIDNLPCRGFAGQILFFTSRGTEPVKVNGDVHIYVFDDLGTPEEQAKPIHRFDFDKESFQAFLTETNLGIAYQLFVPYTRKTAHKATCSLRVKVTPEGGRDVYSKMASVILSGTKAPEPVASASTSAIQQTSYQTEQSPPQRTTSPEAAAAYFGGASLPGLTPDLTADRERLRAKLSEVVQESATNQPVAFHPLQETPAPTTPTPTSARSLAPSPAKHPLAED